MHVNHYVLHVHSVQWNAGMGCMQFARVDISGNSSFESNFTDESGGGIYADRVTVSINGYSGFINNFAKEFGSGLYVIDASRINISGNNCFTGTQPS